jgi:adenylate cyclase
MFRRRLIPTLFGLLLVIALVAMRAADPYPIQVVREIAFDFYQRLAPREQTADLPVRIVDIDEASLAEIGQWPWPRDKLALLTERLTELGAAAIAYDVLFPEPDRLSPRRLATGVSGVDPATLPDTDEQFAQALGRSPSIMGFADAQGVATLPRAPKSGVSISGTSPIEAVPRLRGATLPLQQFIDAAAGLGILSLDRIDAATTVRRLPLLWSDGTQFFPSLSIEALRVAMGAENLLVFGETGSPYVESVRIADFTVPTMSGGELWLYYRPPDPALYVPAKDILGTDYQSVADRVAGQIVLVGTSASGLLDIHGTTLGDNVPGVSIHAQALEQILTGVYLTRADWVSGLEVVGFFVLGASLVLTVLQLGPLLGLLLGAVALGGVAAFSWFAFRTWGLMVDPSFPLLGLAFVYAALVFLQFRIADADKRQIRRAFGYYVAPSLLTEIERNSDRLKLGGERRDMTVMFTDMRNFTGFSEQHTPEKVLAVLNTMFGSLGQQVVEEKGTIDKFIGDSIMAFWNAPVDVPDHARHACRAALRMRTTLNELNARDAFALGGDPVVIGMGIATGEVLVGNMGLESRFDYSCIGDTVNVASRVEGSCKTVGYDIVVTGATRTAAPDFAYLEAGALTLKGKAAREPIFALVGDAATARSAAFAALEVAHKRAVANLGTKASDAVIAECMTLSAAVEPGLAKFYEALGRRADDYPAAPAVAVSA